MIEMHWWIWVLLYSAGMAVFAWWHLREMRRNRVYKMRMELGEDMVAALLTLAWVPIDVGRRLFHVAFLVGWPLNALALLVADVPGFGRNITDEERDEIQRG